MKAYEFPVKVSLEGTLDIPEPIVEMLPRGQLVRVIVLINEPGDVSEQEDWARLTVEQFFAGYSEADAIYDQME